MYIKQVMDLLYFITITEPAYNEQQNKLSKLSKHTTKELIKLKEKSTKTKHTTKHLNTS